MACSDTDNADPILPVEPDNSNPNLELTVNVSEFEISGEAQSFSFQIDSEISWTIEADDWLTLSENQGTGSKNITVVVDDNFYKGRGGQIAVSTINGSKTIIKVFQAPIFSISEIDKLIRTFKGYNDTYTLYGKYMEFSLYPGVDEKYLNLMSEMEDAYNKECYGVKGDKSFVVPDISLYVNEKPFSTGLEININQERMDPNKVKDISYYQSISRSEMIEFLKTAPLDHSMLASWPGENKIRFEMALTNDENTRYYLRDVQEHSIQSWLDYSLFNFNKPSITPSIGANEYCMNYDRFEGRSFKDKDGNIYTFNMIAKKLQDIPSINLSLMQVFCPYNYSTSETYPIVSIKKNNELMYELVNFMYVEWLGLSLNTNEEAYCTGFSSSLTMINEQGIDVYLNSGVDDDSNAYYELEITTYTDYNKSLHTFQSYQVQRIDLYPVGDQDKPIAGIRK